MNRLYLYIVLLVFLGTSCSRVAVPQLDPINTESAFCKKAFLASQDISNIAFDLGDTTSLKILIERINDGICKTGEWSRILNTLHNDINIRKRSSLSVDEMHKLCYPEADLKKYDEENIDIVKQNAEILTLMKDGVITYDFGSKHFSIAKYTSLIEFLSNGGFEDGQTIADVGGGFNNLGIIIGALFPNSEIYFTEVENALLDDSSSRIETYSALLDKDNFHFIEGDCISTNLPDKVDWILLRKTFHHFDYPHKMLNSIKSSLNKDGKLLVFEVLPQRKRRETQCKRLMKKNEILKIFALNGLELQRQRISRKRMYLLYTTNANL